MLLKKRHGMKLIFLKKLYSFFLHDNNVTWLIVINCFITFMLSFNNIPLYIHDILVNLDLYLTLIFGVEVGIKLKVFGKRFFKKGINIFDLIVISLGILPLFFSAYLERLDFLLVLRTVRIFKCTRLFRAIPNFERLLTNLKIAFRASIGVIVGIFILIFIISIILSSLYSKVVPEYFGNPIESIYTVFRMFTIEGWYDIPNAIADNTSPLIGTISKIAFCLIVLIGGMFGMSFVTSSFTDELAIDNNDNVMKELQELKEMIKEQNKKNLYEKRSET